MQQSTLALPFATSFSNDDFIVTDSNREAYEWVNIWPDWPHFCLNLYGPAGSGKTHLARIWESRVGDGAAECHVIEIGETIENEKECLHKYNWLKERQGWLLIISGYPLARLPVQLADLQSRLASVPAIALHNPDDDALRTVLYKLCADRQLRVPDEVVAYLLPRMERSFDTAVVMVECLDRLSIQHQRRITLPLARQMLEAYTVENKL